MWFNSGLISMSAFQASHVLLPKDQLHGPIEWKELQVKERIDPILRSQSGSFTGEIMLTDISG